MKSFSNFNFMTLLGGIAIIIILMAILSPTLIRAQRDSRKVANAMAILQFSDGQSLQLLPYDGLLTDTHRRFCPLCGRPITDPAFSLQHDISHSPSFIAKTNGKITPQPLQNCSYLAMMTTFMQHAAKSELPQTPLCSFCLIINSLNTFTLSQPVPTDLSTSSAQQHPLSKQQHSTTMTGQL